MNDYINPYQNKFNFYNISKKKNIKYNSERYKKKFKMKDEIYLNLWHSNDDVEEDQ